MTDLISQLLDAAKRAKVTERQLALQATGNPDALRNIRDGRTRNPRLDTMTKLCNALDLDLVITPKDQVPESDYQLTNSQASQIGDFGLEPVADQDLAELLALLVDAWKGGTERERGRIEQMLDSLPRGETNLPQKIVAFLGWRIIENDSAGSDG